MNNEVNDVMCSKDFVALSESLDRFSAVEVSECKVHVWRATSPHFGDRPLSFFQVVQSGFDEISVPRCVEI
jgi:hypothetical protein